MHKFLKTSRFALALLTAAALTACGGGGGGGDGSTGGGNGGGTDVVVAPNAGTLVTTAPASGYAAASFHAYAYDIFNAARIASGAGAVSASAALKTAGDAHIAYMMANGVVSHVEDANLGSFYAATHTERAEKAGYGANVGIGEVIAGAGPQAAADVEAAGCVNGLLNTVYHADAMLSPWGHVSVSTGTDGLGSTMCLMMFGAKTESVNVRPAGAVTVNPAPSATVDGTWNIGYEVPRPAPTQIPGQTAGTAVMANVYNADYLNAAANNKLTVMVTTFELRNAGNQKVDAVILAHPSITAGAGVTATSDAQLRPGSVFLIPKAGLAAGVYTATFVADVAGKTQSKTWTFTAK